MVKNMSKKKMFRYSEELVHAVKYLSEKGLNSGEIARRLGISPFTVRNIKYMLRKREKEPKTKPRKHRDILDEILKKPVKKATATKETQEY